MVPGRVHGPVLPTADKVDRRRITRIQPLCSCKFELCVILWSSCVSCSAAKGWSWSASDCQWRPSSNSIHFIACGCNSATASLIVVQPNWTVPYSLITSSHAHAAHTVALQLLVNHRTIEHCVTSDDYKRYIFWAIKIPERFTRITFSVKLTATVLKYRFR